MHRDSDHEAAGHLLKAAIRSEGRAVVCALVGDLDFDSRQVAERALTEALNEPIPMLAVELAEVTFCSSTGLNLLLEFRRRAQEAGAQLALIRPSAPVRRVLELTETLSIFSRYDSVEQAVSGLP